MIGGAVFAIALAGPARAEEDIQAWGAIAASGTVSGNLFLWLEGQSRITDEIGGGSQIILRPAIGARIGSDAHAVAGYAYVRTAPASGAVTHEHRPWQQVQFVPVRHANGMPFIISRTRLEQRMIENRTGTGWRLRQFVRVQLPVAKDGKIQAVAFTEGFFNLNTTSWGMRDGVDQWRTFMGMGFPVTGRARLEPGYLNQRIFRAGEDRTNHVLSATMFVRL
ncbi:DUF2490 domain-containing protein [Sphingomonas colocasiae]|uniref:DUF2490 domain-containing protein n=1 Tax=Sphingomonas colocasiae TaxID=1848973 RepID=A0ABS7PKH7_9SPHN|nr:DUF2490 domain-containing protein [Sphingomonas colocasiae]MBY8821733.1 DUF2490 domain-containing protein [Sphingomonas colocasiae]